MIHPGIEMLGTSVLDATTNGQIHYKAIRALADRYAVGAATTMMDLTVEAEAFGSRINFRKDEIPVVADRLVTGYEEIAELKIPALSRSRIPQYLLAASLAAKHINDRPVLAGCIGPFSLAGRLMDMTEIMTALYLYPETVHLLLEKCAAFLVEYITEIKNTGANGIIMAEPAAGLLSHEICRFFSSNYIKPVVDLLQDDHFMIILHNCGNTGEVTREMVYTGAGGLHFGNKVRMKEVLQEVPPNILVLGNLDPVGDFKMATTARMRLSTLGLLEETKGHGNFVLSSGCDIPSHVPAENIDAFFQALHEFNMLGKNTFLRPAV
jgi:uroporphyrinogen decarboxylase